MKHDDATLSPGRERALAPRARASSIHCDACGKPLAPERAVKSQDDDSTSYFCDLRCFRLGRPIPEAPPRQ
jgi:hypothetical protein